MISSGFGVEGGASDVEDALIAPSEAGSSAPASRDPSPPNINARRRIKVPRRSAARVSESKKLNSHVFSD